MTDHSHTCSLCSAGFPCEVEPCRPTEASRCPTCTAALARLDGLPRPRRGALTGVGAVLAVTDAARAARAADLEDQLSVLCERIDVLAPLDPCADDGDTWFRTGVIMGSRDGWLGKQYRPPPDLPPGIPAQCFNFAYSMAAVVAMQIRMEGMTK